MANLGASRDRKHSRTSKAGEVTAGGRKQAPRACTPASLPGPRGHAEGFRHLISFRPRRSEVWVIPSFYRLGGKQAQET